MFAHHCTACDKRQLILPSAIIGMVKVAEGFAVSFTCWCDADQVWLIAAEQSHAEARELTSSAA